MSPVLATQLRRGGPSLKGGPERPVTDDPVYIHDMYQFFKANAASIAYEAYQNNNTSTTDGHQLCPTTPFPRARNAYAQDWQTG